MSRFWGCLFSLTLLAATLCLVGCSQPPAPSRAERIDQSLASARTFLLGQQSKPGVFVSDVYANFKDGDALTPLAAQALHTAGESVKAADYLAAMVKPNGTIDPGPNGLHYPLYTASMAVVLLTPSKVSSFHDPQHFKARDAWLACVRARQLTEDLDWQPADKQYGGWGYCSGIPRKPRPGEFGPSFIESNLSATLFALEALHAAGCPPDDPAIRKALVFVKRCQNYSEEIKNEDSPFDDGGFFFIYDDPVRNKAGIAGKDSTGRERFHSYGSTTADGLRALLLCGVPKEDRRVKAAQHWLETNFSADTHPGNYTKTAELNRMAIYYYYCASVARAFSTLKVREIETREGKITWAETLADELIKRQRPDGSWINPAFAFREDDPVGCTCLATIAVGVCRWSLDSPSTP